MNTIKIAIAEDQALFLKGMVALLNSIEDFKVIVEGENGADLLTQIDEKELSPDIFLLDLRMPEMDGIETTEKIKANDPLAKIIIISAHDDEDIIVHLYNKGANAFLDKNSESEEVEEAIRSVIKSDIYLNKAAERALKEASGTNSLETHKTDELTEREKEILQLVCQQKSSLEISEELNVSVRTVENHRYKLIKKTNSKNLAGLVLYAIKLKILSLADIKIKYY